MNKVINFTVWNNKRNKIKINDFVKCKYIPTGIGFINNILPNNQFEISTVFKCMNDNEPKIHIHILNKKDLEILNYNEVPKHISETYLKYV